MVPLPSLWLPILLSAVFVFIVSAVIHMLLPYHRSDYGRVPDEDKVMASLGEFQIPPGDYVMPYAGGPGAMKSPEYQEKMNRGPVIVMTVMRNGPPPMAKNLALWFIFSVVVSIFAGYIAGRALAPGAEYLSVFRFTGATAFIAYSVALWQQSIWYKRSWATTFKWTFDGLIYAFVTAGAFGWLWPV